MATTFGLHHITAIGGSAKANVGFYGDLLGLRLIKKTVNFDDPGTYHLYYGDGRGRANTSLTFFPWEGIRPGTRGSGEIAETVFTVPEGSLGYWTERLRSERRSTAEVERFGAQVLTFADPDAAPLALVEGPPATETVSWDGATVPAAHAITGIASVGITLAERGATAALLTDVLDYRLSGEDGNRQRFVAPEGSVSAAIDLVTDVSGASAGQGAGSVHHVAFRVADDGTQDSVRARLIDKGFDVTPRIDRTYFHSIYFRGPEGVTFEVATEIPGFTVDETEADLGSALKLPSRYESMRGRIEAALPALA